MPSLVEPPAHAVAAVVRRAIEEDLTPLGDLTSSLLPDDVEAEATLVGRADGILAGRSCATETFRQIDPSLRVEWTASDGDQIEAGKPFGTVSGRLASMLTAERTALNLLGHLSGIATLTRAYVDAVSAAGGRARIWDTRKTTPGLRTLEKAAVRAGGGANHRGNLSDWILVKDNHLALVPIDEIVARARATWPARTVHVECDTIDQVRQATAAGADALLLDNMSVDEVREAIRTATDTASAGGRARPLLEVSGGVTLEAVGSFAALDIDCISIGRITNSAPVLDIGLDITTRSRG